MADAFSSIKGLLESGKYADLTIRCSGEIFKVHCAIVCPRSPFLSKAIDGKFMEATLRDIDLPDDEIPIIRAMIRYLYTDDYNDEDDSSNSGTTSCTKNAETSGLIFNVKMYIVGDKYDIPGLRALATEKYRSWAGVAWNSPEFCASAQHIWENTMESDRQLRDVIVTTIHTNLDTLMDRGEFGVLMKQHGDLCFDVHKLNMGRSLGAIPQEPVVTKKSKKTTKAKGNKSVIWADFD